MRVFARAIQIIRWLDTKGSNSSFVLNNVSSEALTVDLHSLGEELSVYEIIEPNDLTIEKIVIKVFIDCLNSFQQGISIFIFKEDYLDNHGFTIGGGDTDDVFDITHYNIQKVKTNEELFLIANHIGTCISKGLVTIDYSIGDLYNLMCKHSEICKKYSLFNKRKDSLKRLFKTFKLESGYYELFEK